MKNKLDKEMDEHTAEFVDVLFCSETSIRCKECKKRVLVHVTPDAVLCRNCGKDVGLADEDRNSIIATLIDKVKNEFADTTETPYLTEQRKEAIRKKGEKYMNRYIIGTVFLSCFYALVITIVVYMVAVALGLPDVTIRKIGNIVLLVSIGCILYYRAHIIQPRLSEMHSFWWQECLINYLSQLQSPFTIS